MSIFSLNYSNPELSFLIILFPKVSEHHDKCEGLAMKQSSPHTQSYSLGRSNTNYRIGRIGKACNVQHQRLAESENIQMVKQLH